MWLGSVFKMRMRILNTATTEQMGYGSISFFCVLAPEGMNAIVFGGEGGEIRRLLLAQKIYLLRKMIYCYNIMVHLSHTMIAGNIILSSLTASRKQYQNKPQPSDFSPLIPPKKLLNSFMWSQHTENKKNRPLQL